MRNPQASEVWEEQVVIPTYPVSSPEKEPLFIEKRAYQGSSGKVYPLPVTEKLSDKKLNRSYRAVFLENEYLQIMVLPELGGRIQRALDKTNHYDFHLLQSCNQAGAGRPLRALDFRRSGIQLAAASPAFHLHAC
jgi:hypothetical protein